MRELSEVICHRQPLTLPAYISIQEACRQMAEHGVGAVMVVDLGGALRGIFTGRDAIARVCAVGKNLDTPLGDVMTLNPTTIEHDKKAVEALRLMWDGGFRHLPVVKNGKVVGIVSRGDFKGHEQCCLDDERELWEHMR